METLKWLIGLKDLSDDILLQYYENCINYIKSSDNNCPIGEKDLIYYVFLVREYIEAILNGDDCKAFLDEIGKIGSSEAYDLIRNLLEGAN